MRRRDALEAYQAFTQQTSTNVRSLALAALGVVWIFRPEQGLGYPSVLLWAGVLAVSAMSLDFLQSLYGAIAWGSFHRRKELASVSEEEDFKAPRAMNWPTNALFGAKVLALVACYAILFVFFAGTIRTA